MAGRVRRRGRSAIGALAVVAIVGASAGCSVSIGGSSIDTDKLEETIADAEEETRDFRPEVVCPDDVDAEEGDEFTCTATAPDGTSAEILVTQTDDEGNVRWRLVPGGGDGAGDGGATTAP